MYVLYFSSLHGILFISFSFKVYYYKKKKSQIRAEQTEEINRPPKRRLRIEDDNNPDVLPDVSSSDGDEGTGPNLLPDVGVFARAGPSGVPKKPRAHSSGNDDEGTGPNLLPDVGVFARAGPSGVPKKPRAHSSGNDDEGTGPNLLPDVGVFARAGPSGVPSRPTPQGKKPSSSSSSGEWSDPEGRRRAKQCQAEVEAWERKHGHPMWIDCGEGCPDESQSDEEGRKPAQELQEKKEEDEEPEEFENGASDSDQTPPLVIDEDQVQGNDERNQDE